MRKLSGVALEKAQGFIIETGFLSMFVILKLYNRKTEKDESIKRDLMNLRDRSKYYSHLGLVN